MSVTIQVTHRNVPVMELFTEDEDDVPRIMGDLHTHPALEPYDLRQVTVCVKRRMVHTLEELN